MGFKKGEKILFKFKDEKPAIEVRDSINQDRRFYHSKPRLAHIVKRRDHQECERLMREGKTLWIKGGPDMVETVESLELAKAYEYLVVG